MKKKFNILVVEDDMSTRTLLERLLRNSGHAITCVENGRQALNAFESIEFNLILTDWVMPELDGIGLCRAVREKINTASYVYIILLTSKNTRDDILFGLKAGADDYLIKPFNPGELVARINTGIRILNLEIARNEAEAQILHYSQSLEEMVRQRTEQLRNSEEKYHTIIENIEDGYYELDLEGHLTFLNDSALKFGGYPRKSMLQMKFTEYMQEESIKTLIDTYNRVYATGTPVKSVEWLMKTKSGQTRHMDSSISLIHNASGQPSGFRGIVRDVTDQKKLAAELIEKRKQAESANQAKSEFLANISHEIRTPINGIIGMTELILETPLEAHQKELLKVIESETCSLLELINHILDFAKIEAQKMTIEEVPFDLRNTLSDLTRIMTLRTERKGLRFHCDIASEVPSYLGGDPGKLRQILMNLLINALKFTHTGKIELKVDVEQRQTKQVTLRFTIIDTGIGISPDKKHLIFEPFTQADGSTTRKYGGTGLGTTISRHLTELMGGRMEFDSEPGKGSRFWFTVDFSIQTEVKPQVQTHLINLGGLRILMAHASKSIMEELSPHCNSWGGRLTTLCSGHDALNHLKQAVDQQDPFALIIIGGLTADLDGFELSQTIRNSPALNEIPILLLTATGNPGDALRCRQIGINGYLSGVIQPEGLRKAMVMILTRHAEKDPQKQPELITRHSLSEAHRKEILILLVEDYPTNQLLAMKHLRNAGYNVDLAENGQQAVEAFQKKNYDLILMDMQMPVMDGYAATKAIRALESEADRASADGETDSRVPIIATTAHAMKGDRELCLKAGADDYITKPLHKAKLIGSVEKWLVCSDLPRTAPLDADTHASSKISSQAEVLSNTEIPIDFEKAISEFEGDEEFLLGVLKTFLINVDLQIETMQKALMEKDSEVLRKQAHSIKGGAAELAAGRLSDQAFLLEKLSAAGSLEDAGGALGRLDSEYRSLTAFAVEKYPEHFMMLSSAGPEKHVHEK